MNLKINYKASSTEFNTHVLTIVLFGMLVFCTSSSNGQSAPFDRLQIWSKDMISNHKIKSITGYEFHYSTNLNVADSMLKAGTKSSFEKYDEEGRIVERIVYNTYADSESKRKLYTYDSLSNVVKYQQYSGDSLERTENLKYNELNNVTNWHVDFEDENFGDFLKEIKYTKPDIPISASIKHKEEVIASDSIHTYYDVYGRVVLELTYDDQKSLKDSVIYKYGLHDTIFSKKIYTYGELTFKNYLIESFKRYYYRTEEFTHNRFIGVTYKTFNKHGNLVRDKQIHHFPEMNYDIKYSYSDKQEPVKKEVFKNKMEPDIIVFYKLEHFD